MTQPIDVAYVEILPRTKEFKSSLDKDVSKELDKVESHASGVADKIEASFKDAGQGITQLFRDKNGQLRNSLGQFASAAEKVSAGLDAGFETATSAARTFQGTLVGLVSGVGQLVSTGPAGLAVLAAAFVALAGAAAIAAAAVQNLVIIGGFLAATLPGAIVAAVAGFGILAVALNGVSEAFKEQTTQSTKAAGASINNARQVADAQRGVLQAQKDLIKAREDERERIQDIRRELVAARADERRATDNVLKAEYALQQARRTGTPRAIIEAQLALDEANASLDAAKDKTQDLTKENQKADKVGVEGSDQVLRAKEALRDAEDRLATSQQKVSGGAAAQATAFDGLTKSAQAFVNALVTAKERLGPLADAIQEAFFKGTAPLIAPIVDNLLELTPEFEKVSAAFGGIFKEVLKFLGGDAAQAALKSILDGLANFLTAVTPAIGPLLEAFAGLVGQSGEFGDNLGELVKNGLLKLADFVANVDLKQLFEDAKAAVKELLPLVVPLLSSMKDLFDILVPLGKVAIPFVAQGLQNLADAFEIADSIFTPIFDKIDKFLKLLQTDPKLAFEVFKAAVKSGIDSAIQKFDEFLVTVSGNIEKVKTFFKNLPGNIISFGPKFLAAGQALIGKLFEGLSVAGGFLSDVGKKIANSFIRFINRSVIGGLNNGIQAIEDGLNKLPLFDVNLPSIPNIPQFAKGGLTTANTLAELSEKNRPEAVLPLTDSRALRAVGNAITAAGGIGSGINFSEGSVIVNFQGVVPTPAQAFQVGRAVGAGIADRLAVRQLSTAVRAL